jgi:hypothetical protein
METFSPDADSEFQKFYGRGRANARTFRAMVLKWYQNRFDMLCLRDTGLENRNNRPSANFLG